MKATFLTLILFGATSNLLAGEAEKIETFQPLIARKYQPQTFLVGLSGMLLSKTSSQNGQDTENGSANFYNLDVQYNLRSWFLGFGGYSQIVQVGSTEKSIAYGMKAELNIFDYFLAYGCIVKQNYSESTINSRSGAQNVISVGFRSYSLIPFLIYEFAFRKTINTLNVQNGESLPSPIVEKSIVPYIGIGINI